MTNIKNNKKYAVSLIIFLIAIIIIVGMSYAFWIFRASQESINALDFGCFKLELSDNTDAITLTKAEPISDSEGEALEPYIFTITNTCTISANYNVNLEMMDNDNRLSSNYVAIDFNDTGKKLLSDYTSVEPLYSDDDYTAVESRALLENLVLEAGASVTYSLKLWVDDSASSVDEVMNTKFLSKIILNAGNNIIDTKTKYNNYNLLAYITKLAETDTTNIVADDETYDHNLRYIGADPDNYLCFDSSCTNGKWRVIGVMNNMKTNSGETKSLVKIIRVESIGSNAWDSNGTNDWTTASLNTYLNETWYTTNLADYDNLIESVVWKLGGTNTYTSSSNGLASHFYGYERGTTVYSGRPTEWTGKIALMYPSDYGYATSGGSTTDRATCLAKELYNWDTSSVSDCKGNDYLYLGSYEWTLTPYSSSSVSAFYVTYSGYVYTGLVSNSNMVRPVSYLTSNIKILSGNGTNDTPWIIGVE